MSRFRRHYPDQDPPKAHPQRHLTVFGDDFDGPYRINIMLANKKNDIARAVALSVDDAEEMANLILRLVADARKEQQ